MVSSYSLMSVRRWKSSVESECLEMNLVGSSKKETCESVILLSWEVCKRLNLLLIGF